MRDYKHPIPGTLSNDRLLQRERRRVKRAALMFLAALSLLILAVHYAPVIDQVGCAAS